MHGEQRRARAGLLDRDDMFGGVTAFAQQMCDVTRRGVFINLCRTQPDTCKGFQPPHQINHQKGMPPQIVKALVCPDVWAA